MNAFKNLYQKQEIDRSDKAIRPGVFHTTAGKDGFRIKGFCGENGDSEFYITIMAPAHLSFEEQIKYLKKHYTAGLKSENLTPETAVFARLLVSDVMNQAKTIHSSNLLASGSDNPVAISLIQQLPLPGSKIALQAYHVRSRGNLKKILLSKNHLLLKKNNLGHLWSTGLCSRNSAIPVNIQTCDMFDELIDTLVRQQGTLRENCVRTWIYLKDVDVFYQQMADSRRELFTNQGLTTATHYIASTGIEGACEYPPSLVYMDAYSILGMAPQQVSYLNDFSRLCPTKDYNITFERGTRISYADRSHHFISGTASIDRKGMIVYPGDVLRQLEMALGNVEALLRSGSADLDDMMYLTVYLRDPSDFPCIDDYLCNRFPELPVLIVQGAVCRPGWLVEVEGIAIAANNDPSLPVF